MTPLSTPHTRRTQLGWIRWASVLIALYLVLAVVAWERTLRPDEIWGLLHAQEPVGDQLDAVRWDLVHPPFMYLVERAWLRAFGRTDDSAKALPLLINTLTLGLFTWSASRLTRHWRLVSLLFASTFFRSGEVANLTRMYGLTLLLTVSAFVFWERWRIRPQPPRLIVWTVTVTLLTYTHYSGILLLAAFVVVGWLYAPRPLAFGAAVALATIALLPWLVYSFPIFEARGLQPNLGWVDREPVHAVLKLPFFFLSAIPSGWNPFGETPAGEVSGARRPLIVVAALLMAALVVLALPRVRLLWPPGHTGGDDARWFWSAVVMVGMPVGLLYAVSELGEPAFDARFLVAVLPAFWILVVFLGEFGRRAGVALLYCIVLPWVLISIAVTVAPSADASPARQVTTLLADKVNDGDLILCDSLAGPQVYWEWTRRLGRTGRLEVLYSAKQWRWWAPVLPQRKWSEIDLHAVERVWFVYRDPNAAAEARRFFIENGFGVREPAGEGGRFVLAFDRTVRELPA